jgi:capsid protein
MGVLAKIKDFFSSTWNDANFENNVAVPVKMHSSYPSQYNSGYYGVGSGGEKWPYGLSASGTSPYIDHAYTRQNARSAYHENVQARSIVDRFADVVVDVGLEPKSNPAYEQLGITQEQAETWSRDVDARFRIWASDKRSCRDETMTFYQMQRMAEIFQQRDNDYFVRFYYSNSRRLLNPLQLAFIDSNQIRGDAVTSSYGFQYGADGINRDVGGKEISYRVYMRKPLADGGWEYVETTIPAIGPRSGLRMMIHGFQAEYAGQLRGYSRLHHALQEFENLTDFTTAQIKKAINQSNLVLSVVPSKDNPASNFLEDITSPYAAPASIFGADPQVEGEGDAALPLNEYLQCHRLQEAIFDTPGSTVVTNLQEGEDIKPFVNTSPSQNFDTFVNAFTSQLAASMSIPLEVLLMKFSNNYSASRGALILFWRVAQIWRNELISDFLTPVRDSWLNGEIASGRVSAPGWQDPRIRQMWLQCTWTGAAIPNIDPLHTAKADQINVELGAQTLDYTARENNGSDATANRARLRREISELSIPPWSKNFGGISEEDTDGESNDG